METCKTCRWWDSRRQHLAHEACGTCEFVDSIFCVGKEAGTKTFTVEATSDDDQGLEARLITGPDFGCVHHQAREGANRHDDR